MNECFVCGAYSPWPYVVTVSPDKVVCPDCENAKGGWEDVRLNDYGQLIK